MHCHSPSGSLFYTALSSSNEANQNVRSSLNTIYAFINFLAGSYIQPSSNGAGQAAMKTMMTTTTTTMKTIQQSRKAVHIQKNGNAFTKCVHAVGNIKFLALSLSLAFSRVEMSARRLCRQLGLRVSANKKLYDGK